MLTNKFSKDVIYTFSTQLATLILAVTVHIILARTLGLTQLGLYTFILLKGTVLMRFLTFGCEVSNVYFTSKNTFPIRDIKNNTLMLSIFSSLLGAIVLILVKLSGLEHYFTAEIPGLFWWAYPIFVFLLFEELFISIFLGLRQIRRFNLLKLLRPVSFLLLILLIIVFGFESLKAFLSGFILSLSIVIFVLTWILKPSFSRPNFRLMKETFRYGLKAYTANTVSFINYRFDMFLILYFLSPVELGYYAVAVMIGEKLWYLSMATGTVLFPRIASSPKPDASLTLKTAALNLYIILLAAILLGIFSHLLIGIFYGDVYVFAAEALIFLLPGIVAMAIPKLLMADLSGRGKPEYAMIASLCSLIVNVLLNIILIPVYGILGAAIASSIAYIVAALVFMYYYKRETSVNLRELFILKIGDITRIKAEI